MTGFQNKYYTDINVTADIALALHIVQIMQISDWNLRKVYALNVWRVDFLRVGFDESSVGRTSLLVWGCMFFFNFYCIYFYCEAIYHRHVDVLRMIK